MALGVLREPLLRKHHLQSFVTVVYWPDLQGDYKQQDAEEWERWCTGLGEQVELMTSQDEVAAASLMEVSFKT